jgi:glycogen debranching enzyme
MDTKVIVAQLQQDIAFLQDVEYGYIRAGWPHFMALFGRDSAIIAWQLLDYDPNIARSTIAVLARLQGKEVNAGREEEPGKIIHEWHPDPARYKPLLFPLPYYGSVDSTPLFIWLAARYFKKTRDLQWLREYWPSIERALEWCRTYGDPDGDFLLEYERKNPLGLFHQGWKDGSAMRLLLKPPIEIIEAQGYHYAALTGAAEMAEALGASEQAGEFRMRSRMVRQAVMEKFWVERGKERPFFALAAGADGAVSDAIASNPGQLLCTGILGSGEDAEKIDALLRQLFSPAMWTPYGIRTHAASNADFNPRHEFLGAVWPHDNWIIAQGLKALGFREEYRKIKTALRAAYEALGKIPEFYAVVDGSVSDQTEPRSSCSPQGWASGALLNLLLEDL